LIDVYRVLAVPRATTAAYIRKRLNLVKLFVPFRGSLVYFPCIRVVPLCPYFYKLQLIIKKKKNRLLKSRKSNSKNPSSLHYEDSLLKFFVCLALKPSRHLLFQASKVLRILPSAIKNSLHVVYNLSSVFSFTLTHKL